jgi:hypothetical protein
MPPPEVRKTTIAGWLVLSGIATAIAYGMLANLPLRWGFGGWFVLIAVFTLFHRRWLRRVKEERKEESICSFARALPAKEHDTWVVRAVYEEMSRVVGGPLRPSDDIKRFWRVDPDDLDDVAFAIARRAGRSMDDTKKNPMFDRVFTIADMIVFFEHQPKLRNQAPEPTAPSGRGSPLTFGKTR